jgi:hypothetical protein
LSLKTEVQAILMTLRDSLQKIIVTPSVPIYNPFNFFTLSLTNLLGIKDFVGISFSI